MPLRSLVVACAVAFSSQVLAGQAPAVTAGGGPTEAAAYATNPKFVQAMREGDTYLKKRQPAFAKDAFNKANKIAGGSCWNCLAAVYDAQFAEADFKGALQTTQKMESVAANPMQRSMTEFDRGDAILTKAGEKAKPDQLQEA
jgi:hypothetical protein